MATYLQGVTDTNLDPVLYTPDYSFLKNVLQKKTASYQQGLAEVSTAYNNLNSELSSPLQKQRRDDYLSRAQSQLQKIAGSDLSLGANVNAANAVFSPLATDESFLYDSFHTGNNKKQLAKMDEWRQSEDPEKRKLFNQDLYNFVQRDLDPLRNDKMGNVTSGVRGRKAWGYVDGQSIINQYIKDNSIKFQKDILGAPYVVHVENGVTFKESYKEFAKQVLAADNTYQTQSAMLGENKSEELFQQYKYMPQNAGFTDMQLNQQIANDHYATLRNNQELQLKSINSAITKQDADLEAYTKLNKDKIAAGDAETIQEMQQRVNGLNNSKKQQEIFTDRFTESFGSDNLSKEEKKQIFTSSFVQNPRMYFSNLYQNNDISRFTNIRSSVFDQTVKSDSAYLGMIDAKDKAQNTANNIANTLADNEREDKKYALEVETQNFKERVKNGKDKNGDKSIDDKDNEVKLTAVSTEVFSSTEKIKDYKNRINTASAGALENMTGASGAFSLMEEMGLSPQETGQLRTAFEKFHNTGYNTPDKETQNAMGNAFTKMYAFAKENKDEQAIKKLGEMHGKILRISMFPDMIEQSAANFPTSSQSSINSKLSLVSFKENNQLIKQYSSNMETAMQLVAAEMIDTKTGVMKKGKEEFEGMFYKNTNTGLYEIVGEDQIIKQLPGANSNGKPLNEQTKKKIAEEYINGSLKFSGVSTTPVIRPGVPFDPTNNYFGSSITLSNGMNFSFFNQNVFDVNPDVFKKNIKKINEQVSIPEYQGDGLRSAVIFTLNGNPKQETLQMLGQLTTNNSNIFVMEGAQLVQSPGDAAEYKKIRNSILAKSESEGGKDIPVQVYTQTSQGTCVKVTFPDAKIDSNSVEPYAGNSYFFPITPTASSPAYLNLLGNMATQGIYQNNLKTGTPYVFNTFEKEGIRYKYVPLAKDDSRGKLYVESKLFNEQTKQYDEQFTAVGEPLIFDVNKRNFAELNQDVMQTIVLPYLASRSNFLKMGKMQKSAEQPALAPEVKNFLVSKNLSL